MSDHTNSRPDFTAAVTELIQAGTTLSELLAIDWNTVPREEIVADLERWQRAVLQVATLNMQRSNEATE